MNKIMLVALCLAAVTVGCAERVVIGYGNEEIDSGTADADAAAESAADSSGSEAPPDAGDTDVDAQTDAVDTGAEATTDSGSDSGDAQGEAGEDAPDSADDAQAKDCWIKLWQSEYALGDRAEPFGRKSVFLSRNVVQNLMPQHVGLVVHNLRPSFRNQPAAGLKNLRLIGWGGVPVDEIPYVQASLPLTAATGEFTDYLFVDSMITLGTGEAKEFYFAADVETFEEGAVFGTVFEPAFRGCDATGCPFEVLSYPPLTPDHICFGEDGSESGLTGYATTLIGTKVTAYYAADNPSGMISGSVSTTIARIASTASAFPSVGEIDMVGIEFGVESNQPFHAEGHVATIFVDTFTPICETLVQNGKIACGGLTGAEMEAIPVLPPGAGRNFRIALDTTGMQSQDVLLLHLEKFEWRDTSSPIPTNAFGPPLLPYTLSF